LLSHACFTWRFNTLSRSEALPMRVSATIATRMSMLLVIRKNLHDILGGARRMQVEAARTPYCSSGIGLKLDFVKHHFDPPVSGC